MKVTESEQLVIHHPQTFNKFGIVTGSDGGENFPYGCTQNSVKKDEISLSLINIKSDSEGSVMM